MFSGWIHLTDVGDVRDEVSDSMPEDVELPRLCDPSSVDNYFGNDSGVMLVPV